MMRVFAPLAGGDPVAYRDSLVAMSLASVASIVSGITLASITGTLQELPGLLLLVPAALAVKGNVFGALGSRLGTSIHAGTFRPTIRLDSIVGQNTVAALALSLTTSVLLGILAKAVAIIFSVSPTMSLADFMVISTIGGLLASVVVLAITLLLASGSVRYEWDLDNVVAPLVNAVGDLVSLPALVIAVQLAGIDVLTPTVAVLMVVAAAVVTVWAMRSRLDLVPVIMRESLPVLTMAGIVDLVAGITMEKRLDDLLQFPVLLILLPGFLNKAGSLGGILSSRLATKFHLGLLAPDALPRRGVGRDITMTFSLAVPVFFIAALTAQFGGIITGNVGPGTLSLVAATMVGGLIATACLVVVSYYSTVVAVRFGLDPDTYGIPIVASTLDFVGAFALILALVWVGVI